MTVTITPQDQEYARIARKHGMKNSLRALVTARNVARGPIAPSLALALLTQESTDGSNVWGHDPPPNGGTQFVMGQIVTESRYKRYKKSRDVGGNGRGGMQGVGPPQLTWWEAQDRADRLGGCWKPKYSLQVAYEMLALLIAFHGKRKALAIYNGGATNPQWKYADSVLRHEMYWHRLLT